MQPKWSAPDRKEPCLLYTSTETGTILILDEIQSGYGRSGKFFAHQYNHIQMCIRDSPLYDINIVKGQGCKVWDENGTEYLDLYGGHAVISIGHAHPHYVETVSYTHLDVYKRQVLPQPGCR